jgi:hypothetical protein
MFAVKRRGTIRASALGVVVAIGFAACSGSDSDSTDTTSASTPSTEPETTVAETTTPETTAPETTADETDGAVKASAELGADEAAEIADEIAATFSVAEFSPVEELLGDDGMWLAHSGEEYDRSTIGPFLASFTDSSGISSYIVDVTRADGSAEGTGGFWFQMSETLSNEKERTFWIGIARNDDGVLVVTERLRPPQS